MSQSALQLERYFFAKVAIEAQPKNPENSGVVETKREVSKNNTDRTQFMVALTVKLNHPEGKIAPYCGEVVVIGFFRVHPDYPKPEDLVAVNGVSILYGVVREMIVNVTSRGPWPPITIPCISINEKPASESRQTPETQI